MESRFTKSASLADWSHRAASMVPSSDELRKSQSDVALGASRRGFSRQVSPSRQTSGKLAPELGGGGPFAGRLRVRCVGATGLPAADCPSSWLTKATSDPYAELSLKVNGEKHWKSHRTRTVPQTLDPSWHQEFAFDLRGEIRHLTLNIEVFDEDEEDEWDYLGTVQQSLNKKQLLDLAGNWRTFNSAVRADPAMIDLLKQEERKVFEARGSLQFKVRWEPAGFLSYWAILYQVAHSPTACLVLGALQVGTAGILLLVAYTARWLCRGPTFPGCQEVLVPGPQACCLFGAFASFVSTAIRLAGATGVLGHDFDAESLGLLHSMAFDQELGEIDDSDEDEPGVVIEIGTTYGTRWGITFRTNLCPWLLPAKASRFTAWMLHFLGLTMAALACGLARLHRGNAEFLVEASYLTMAATGCFLGGAFTIIYGNSLANRLSSRYWSARQTAELFNANTKARTSAPGNKEPGLLDQNIQRAKRTIGSFTSGSVNSLKARFQHSLERPLLSAVSPLKASVDSPDKDAGASHESAGLKKLPATLTLL